MMSEREMAGKPRRGRGWKILLVLSLALNLLFIGLIGGAMARFGGPFAHDRGQTARGASLGAAVFRALPRDDRRAMFRKVAGARDRDAAGADELLTTLRADALDRGALAAFADGQGERRRAHGVAIAEAWVENVAAMSVEERRAYADRIEEILNAPREAPRWWGHRSPPD